MASETKVKDFRINYLTKTQYETERVKPGFDENALYLIADESEPIPTKMSELEDDVTTNYTTSEINALWSQVMG